MRSYVGIGKGNVKDAVRDAVNGIGNPSAIIFLSSFSQIRETAEILAQKFQGISCIGTLGTKLANGEYGDDSLVVLGLYDDAKTECGVIKDISLCPVAAIGEINEKVNRVSPGRENTVCIEFCTNDEEKLVTTFNSCLEKRGVKLAGGTVFGVPDGKKPVVAYNGRVFEDACVYAIIKNTTGKVGVFKENIYEKKTDKYHFASKVDTLKKAVIELDGRPAADVYSNEVGVPKNKIVENVFNNPMGRAVGEEVYISSMMDMDSRGALYNYKRINKNDCIYFLSLGDYKEIERNNRESIKASFSKISLVFSIDCIYRYLLYQQEKYFDTYVHDMAELGNHVGIIGGGEQFNNQHVNQTMVCAVFE